MGARMSSFSLIKTYKERMWLYLWENGLSRTEFQNKTDLSVPSQARLDKERPPYEKYQRKTARTGLLPRVEGIGLYFF